MFYDIMIIFAISTFKSYSTAVDVRVLQAVRCDDIISCCLIFFYLIHAWIVKVIVHSLIRSRHRRISTGTMASCLSCKQTLRSR